MLIRFCKLRRLLEYELCRILIYLERAIGPQDWPKLLAKVLIADSIAIARFTDLYSLKYARGS